MVGLILGLMTLAGLGLRNGGLFPPVQGPVEIVRDSGESTEESPLSTWTLGLERLISEDPDVWWGVRHGG